MCRVFKGLQKALDTISHEILLEKLNHYGIKDKENDWFCSFLPKGNVVSIGFFSHTNIARSASKMFLGTSTICYLHK